MKNHEGRKVKKIRESLDLSQSALAEMVGVSRVTIARWEGADRLPAGRAGDVATALGVSVDAIRATDTLSMSMSDSVVSSEEGLNKWTFAVFRADLPQDVRIVLSALGTFINKSIWAAPVSLEALASETTIDDDLIRRVWPQVLRSEWLERIGPAEYVFRLKFPNNDH